jgi:hypothetical protein
MLLIPRYARYGRDARDGYRATARDTTTPNRQPLAGDVNAPQPYSPATPSTGGASTS